MMKKKGGIKGRKNGGNDKEGVDVERKQEGNEKLWRGGHNDKGRKEE